MSDDTWIKDERDHEYRMEQERTKAVIYRSESRKEAVQVVAVVVGIVAIIFPSREPDRPIAGIHDQAVPPRGHPCVADHALLENHGLIAEFLQRAGHDLCS